MSHESTNALKSQVHFDRVHRQALDRANRMASWAIDTASEYEGRDTASFERAIASMRGWVARMDHESPDAPLAKAWEAWWFIKDEPIGPLGHAMRGFPPIENPGWDRDELDLVFAGALAAEAVRLLQADDAASWLAALLELVDATEAQAQWLQRRGPLGCRHVPEGRAEVERHLEQLSAEPHIKAEKHRLAFEAATARRTLDRDGKAAAKKGAKALWLERDQGKHRKLGLVSQFAIEVMRRWPVLKNQKTIERWSAQWSREKANAKKG